MSGSARRQVRPNDGVFVELVRAIALDDLRAASRLISASPKLVDVRVTTGASRNETEQCFVKEIKHYLYAGDTALHVAAAGFRSEMVRELIIDGADCCAANRRGAQPLHYAADTNTWNPAAQVATIRRLIQAGADPNSTDTSGVAPLHRAVRTRSAAAVASLLDAGADPRGKNRNGSTPLHLAVQNTGRSGSGSPHAMDQQKQIIVLLLQNGATPDERDGHGQSVHQVAAARLKEFLESR